MSAPRLVVCGTTFGRLYLAALDRPEPPAVLAGVLARGSARSVAVAERYGVPLYRAVEELPDDVELACVAVRAAVIGGVGGELVTALLERGVHVLQEHPVHHDELAGALRLARRRGVLHRLNSHYPHLPAVRRFLAAARELYRYGPPRFVDAATSVHVAFAFVDLLGRALPSLRPWAFADPAPWPDALRGLTDASPPLRSVDGVIGGVPLTLRVHNQLDPSDPDNHAHLMHRITIGTDHGSLTLVNTHGPVVWSPRMHVTDYAQRDDLGAGDPHLALPSTGPLGDPHAAPYAEVIGTQWPDALAATIDGFATAARAGEDPLRLGQYHLTVTRIWQDLTSRLGQPEIVRSAPPHPLTTADLEPLGDGQQVNVTVS
ncbi:MAG TPA: Gfo/Idh/MocA family oxidoreductase [Pseudonocardiaceae bacterium]